MEKYFNTIVDLKVDGIDSYQHNGSTWLIFTETKQWVIEYTKDRTLWYNYSFFNNLSGYISVEEPSEIKDYVKNWFESRFLSKSKVNRMINSSIFAPTDLEIDNTIENGVRSTFDMEFRNELNVEDTIQNGIKDTIFVVEDIGLEVEDTIQNGVKHTASISAELPNSVEDTIQNGVKHTIADEFGDLLTVEDTIQNGVKDTKLSVRLLSNKVEDTIQNGVKKTEDGIHFFEETTENVIKYGVKHVEDGDWLDQDERIDDIIEDGVKYCCGTSGNARKGTIQDVFENGVKDAQSETHHRRREVIQTIKDGVKEVQEDVYHNKGRVDGVIKNGVIQTNPMDEWVNSYNIVTNVIDNGVKDVRTPGVGDLESTMDFMNENDTLDVQKLLDDVIENGVKEIKTPGKDGNIKTTLEWLSKNGTFNVREMIDNVIENGVKETKEISNNSLLSEIFKVNSKQAIRDGVKELKVWKSDRYEEHGYFEFVDGNPTYTPMTQVKDVIENGVKEMQPLPAQDGNRDWGIYYQRQKDKTKPHTEYVDEVIKKGTLNDI